MRCEGPGVWRFSFLFFCWFLLWKKERNKILWTDGGLSGGVWCFDSGLKCFFSRSSLWVVFSSLYYVLQQRVTTIATVLPFFWRQNEVKRGVSPASTASAAWRCSRWPPRSSPSRRRCRAARRCGAGSWRRSCWEPWRCRVRWSGWSGGSGGVEKRERYYPTKDHHYHFIFFLLLKRARIENIKALGVKPNVVCLGSIISACEKAHATVPSGCARGNGFEGMVLAEFFFVGSQNIQKQCDSVVSLASILLGKL